MLSGNDAGMRGKLEGIEVAAGVPVTMLRIEVRPGIAVKGKIDMAMFAKKPQWAWISFHAPLRIAQRGP